LADKEDFAAGKGNNRETMPINDRTVYLRTSSANDSAASLMVAGAAFLASALALF